MTKSNIAVFSVCRNESKFLPIWLKYYSKIFGLENIFLFDDNSSDGCFDGVELINYELIKLGRDPKVERFGVHDYNTLWQFIVEKYIELLKIYKWVIHVDIDDFIVPNPEKYNDLKHYIDSNKRDYFRCTAYEILHNRLNEKSIDWNKQIIKQRTTWIRISNLDKTCIVSKRLDLHGPGSWVIGNHYAYGKELENPDSDLLLIHLHRIDYDNYKKKYFVVDERIKTDKDFMNLYKGYPLFWQEKDLDVYFDSFNSNEQWGAKPAIVENIPDVYKGVF